MFAIFVFYALSMPGYKFSLPHGIVQFVVVQYLNACSLSGSTMNKSYTLLFSVFLTVVSIQII